MIAPSTRVHLATATEQLLLTILPCSLLGFVGDVGDVPLDGLLQLCDAALGGVSPAYMQQCLSLLHAIRR